MYEIIPGILEKDWIEIERKINLVKPFAKTIQIDVADGRFVENKTFLDPQPFSKYSSGIFFEAHLMVKNPLNYLRPFADAGFKRFVAHVESFSQPEEQFEFVAQAELLGEVGLAIDVSTEIDSVKANLEDLDMVLIMTVKAGLSGQQFNHSCLEKIKRIREKSNIPIEVDGAINEETINLAKKQGANKFIANSFLFKNNPYEQFKFLQQKI